MTPHQILIVGIRLLVIFWLLSLIGQAGAVLVMFQGAGDASTLYLGALGLQLATAVVLWMFPATIASKLLRAGNVPVQPNAVTFDEWRELIFVGVGIFVLARAVPKALYWTVVATGSEASFTGFGIDQKANVLVTELELAIGLILTLGATGLAALVKKGRRVGVASSGSAGG